VFGVNLYAAGGYDELAVKSLLFHSGFCFLLFCRLTFRRTLNFLCLLAPSISFLPPRVQLPVNPKPPRRCGWERKEDGRLQTADGSRDAIF